MLLGAVGCQKCDCKPCQACEAACDDTPAENFQTVYQANDTDGVLSWSGDAMGPIDGPFAGFEGSGPFSQTITRAEDASIGLPSDRFPCYARLRVWKNISGGTGSEAVTSSITIICTSGRIRVGMFELSGGESLYIGPASHTSTATYRIDGDDPIPTVAGDMDQSMSYLFGSFVAEAICSPATLSLTASISWSNADIQHSLYGQFMECYDDLPPGDQDDCLDCDGTPTPQPDPIYLTISNFDSGGAKDYNGDNIDWSGTYAISPAFTCGEYRGQLPLEIDLGGGASAFMPAGSFVAPAFAGGLWLELTGWQSSFGSGGGMLPVHIRIPLKPEWAGTNSFVQELCGAGPITGSVEAEWRDGYYPFALSGYSASFDWEISW